MSADWQYIFTAELTQKIQLLLQAKYSTTNAILQDDHVEIDQKAHLPTSQAQRREQLRFVDWRDRLDCLDLNADDASN